MKTELKKTKNQTNKIPKGDGNKNVTNHITKFTLLEASAFSLNFRRLPWDVFVEYRVRIQKESGKFIIV